MALWVAKLLWVVVVDRQFVDMQNINGSRALNANDN